MSRGNFILTADVAALIQGFVNVNRAQDKTEAGFKKTAQTGRTSMRSLEQEMKRLESASQQAATRTVASTRMRAGSAQLALTSVQRASLSASTIGAATGTDLRGLQDISLQRRLLAQGIRQRRSQDRQFQQFLSSERSVAGANSTIDSMFARATAGYDETSLSRVAASQRRSKLDKQYDLDAELASMRLQSNQDAKVKSAQRRQQLAGAGLAIGVAVTGLVNEASAELNRYADTIAGFESTMAPLYGVGGNMARRPRLRSEVLAMSGAYGLPVEQTAELKGRLQSTFGDLPESVAREIETQAAQSSRLGVKDLPTFAVGLGAMYQSFGEDLGGGAGAARTLASMFEKSADVGGFQKDEITPYLSRVMQSFKAAGYKPQEALSALALVSQSGLNPEVYATGLGNMALDLVKANAAGDFQTTGNFRGDLGALAQRSPDELLGMVGERNFVVTKLLTDQVQRYDRIAAYVSKTSAKENAVGGKVALGLADPMSMTASTIASAKQAQANAPALIAGMPGLGDTIQDWEVRKLGAEMEIHPAMKAFKMPAAWLDWATGDARGGGGLLGTGARQMINDATAAGDQTKAGYLQLRYGKNLGTSYKGKDYFGNPIPTGKEEADEYLGMVSSGYSDLSGDEYLEYKRLGAAGGAAQADAWAKKAGKYQAPSTQPSGEEGGKTAEVAAAMQQLILGAEAVVSVLGTHRKPMPNQPEGFRR